MSISTYDELQAAITDWVKRSDQTAAIPNIIQLAEAEFNRELRATEMETRATATADGEYLVLPSDCLDVRSLHVEGSPDRVLKYYSPQELSYITSENYSGTIPFCYTVVDGQFKFYPAPTADATLDLEIIYIQKIPALSDSNTTNWLLTRHPDLYLSCCLSKAEKYIHNDQRVAMWTTEYKEIIAWINREANKRRVASTPLNPIVRNIV